MSIVNIRGIDVRFPYEKPYNIQIDYMDKVIECLEDKKHGVLESPTGTGKTLCLFAPVTSWLQSKKKAIVKPEVPNTDPLDAAKSIWSRKQRVWYTARTHSQIAQTVAEVRRCDIEGLSVRVMGAREQLCINPSVMTEKNNYIKSVKCKELVKTRSCRFHRNLDYQKHAQMVYQPGQVMDIEDLAAAGRSCGICPYFLAKTAKDNADVVLMPYNYILDRESRGSTDSVTYQNDIVIFDEGHNVPNTCEGSFEFSVSSADLALGLKNTQELMETLAKMKDLDVGSEESTYDIAVHADNCHQIADTLLKLEAGLAKLSQSNQLYPLKDLFDLFEKAGVNEITANNILTSLSAFQTDSMRLQLSGPMLTTFSILEKMLQTLYGSAIRSFAPEIVEKSFKFAVSTDVQVRNSKKLSLFCFNPSFGIKDVLMLGVQSMIITSGTLSPLRTFIHELGLPNPVTIECAHIASKAQVPFMVLGTGVNNQRMDASFKNRTVPAYMYSLGMTLTNLISSVPDGALLLFSSYSVMAGLKEYWEKENIWKRLNGIKEVFMEPREKEEFISCIENYRRAIDAGNGAILMGVLRGKVSEGMDFKDQYCRAVFVVGVPFPPVMDPRVKGKERYTETLFIQNATTKRDEKLYETPYNSVEAMKATNQAIGRVIRHGADYGAIILVDYRFAWARLFGNISPWLRGDKPVEVNFMTAKKTLKEFFRNVSTGELGVPEVRRQKVSSNGEPIVGNAQYDLYDHKKSRSHLTAPWIASTSGEGCEQRNHYNVSPDSGIDVVAKYGAMASAHARSMKVEPSCWSSPQKTPPLQPKTEPTSFLEALECADVKPPLYTAYREVDLALLSDIQKRKIEETSPSLLASEKKKMCRRVVTVDATAHEPEPEAVPIAPIPAARKAALKDDLLTYILKTRNSLAVNEANEFKETVWRYMKGIVPLEETVAVLKTLLQNDSERLLGFSCCIRKRDKTSWEEISKTWK